jgi:hypothetical protein
MRGGAATLSDPMALFARIGYHKVLAAEAEAHGKPDLASYYRGMAETEVRAAQTLRAPRTAEELLAAH